MKVKRPSKVYRKLEPKAYTKKKYIKRIPPSIIQKFTMGDTTRDFPIEIKLIVLRDGQISDNALESVRTSLNRRLENEIGNNKYRFHIHPFPHHFSREHGLVGVAKSERFVKGMRLGFGTPNRRFARVHKGQTIVTVGIDEERDIGKVRAILKIATKKLPFVYKIISSVS